MKNPGSRMAIIGPTYQSARDVQVEGESGLLAQIPEKLVRDWNRSIGELTLANGTQYRLFTGEKPSALRGPQHHRSWCDEIATWKYGEDTWDMLQFGLRLGKNPQNVITSTPMPVKVIRDLVADPNTVVSTGSTYENQANLPVNFFSKIISKYEGTRLGLQELYAKLLDDIPGALWQRTQIEATRWRGVDVDEAAKQCQRVVVAIDPAVTSPKKVSSDKEDNDMDETGIVVVGLLANGEGVVLADESCRESPNEWAKRAVRLYKRFHADRIIGEANNGGDLVEEVMRIVDSNIPFRKVIASRGKYVRAEPIAALYEQGRIHHVGLFERLEDQMCTFTPENIEKKSPDRADALVWGMTEIFDGCMNLGLLHWGKERAAEEKLVKVVTAMPQVVSVCASCGSAAMAKIGAGYRCGQCGSQTGNAFVAAIPMDRRVALRGLLQ